MLGNPLLLIDPDGRSVEGSNDNNSLEICPTCPNTPEYDEARNSNSSHEYDADNKILVNSGYNSEIKGRKESETTGLAAISFGLSVTAAYGPGTQTSFDATWITEGKDKSWIPKFNIASGVGVGYNIDVDVHFGTTSYTGYKSDITAENILNTNLEDGQGIVSSVSGSWLGEVGANFSRSKATPRTTLIGSSPSFGLSLTPGPNFYVGKFVSKKF